MPKISRYISMIIFASIVLLILIYPMAFKDVLYTSKHSFVVFLVMLACLAFIHAIGFTPEHKFWKFITHPIFIVMMFITLVIIIVS